MDNDLFQKLKALEKRNEIVSIFTDRNNADTWLSGFIESISKEHIILKHVSPEGKYDGFVARRLDDIFRLDFDGIYEHRLLKLYNTQKQFHEDIFTNKEPNCGNLFKLILQAARTWGLVVTISIDENQENIIGFVKELNSNIIAISKISYEGSNDGECSFYLSDIVSINCDTSDEIVYKLLYTYN